MNFHKKQVALTAIVTILTTLGVLTPVIRSPYLAQGQSPERGMQDVILIVDNSVSMLYAIGTQPPSDPDGLRFIAASVVVNYLAVAAEPSITYRVALVSYAERAATLASLSELGEAYRMQLTQMLDPDNPVMGDVGGWTRHHLALEQALGGLEEYPSPNPVRPPIVIILTDGDFGTNNMGLSAEEYSEYVESAVLALSQQGAVVHAVLLGDRARKNQPEWENLTALTGGQVLTVDKAEELPVAYVQLVRTIVGTIGVGSREKTAEADKTTEFPARELGILLDENEIPYIDSLVVTVWQTRKDISVQFIKPDGQVLVPIPGEMERRGSDYVVVWWIRGGELLAGDWKVLLRGGSQEGRVQIFVDYIPLRSELLIPSVVAARGEPVTLQALLMDRDGLTFDATEALEIEVNFYEEPEKRLVSSETMTLTSEGGKIRHRLKHTFDEAGVYALELLPRLHLKSGETRFLRPPEGLRWPIKIADLPVILGVRLEPTGEAEVGQSVRVWVTVERAEGQKGLTVLAWMKEHDSGRTVWEEDLRLGLRGTFEGGPFSLTSAGAYRLIVALQGEAPLPGEKVGFLYGPDTAHSVQESVEYAVLAPTDLRIENIEVKGQAFRGEPVPIRVQVLGPEGAAVQKVEATMGGEEPIVLQDDGRLPDEREGDGVFSGALLAPTVEGNYRIRVVVQGESMYGVPLSDQGEADLTVTRVDLKIENIEVGGEGQAIRGETVPLRVQVLGPEGASVQKVEATMGGEEPILLQDDGRLPDEREGDGVFSGALLAPTVEGNYRIRVVVQGESMYGVPLSDQEETGLTVTRVDLRLERIEVGREGQAFRGETVPIQVKVFRPEGASVQKVEVKIGDGEPIILQDDGKSPDEQKDDGIFSGTLLAPDRIGSYQIQVIAQGESAYGVSLSDKTEVDLTVELSSWDRARPLVMGGGVSLLGLLALAVYFFWQRQWAPLTGILSVTYPLNLRGTEYRLDDLYLKKATIGVQAGHIMLPLIGEVSTGVKAELKGRWEREYEQRKIAVYVRPRGRSGILVGGRPLERESYRLLDGTTIEVGGITLEYLSLADH